jgi:hypothetical protein
MLTSLFGIIAAALEAVGLYRSELTCRQPAHARDRNPLGASAIGLPRSVEQRSRRGWQHRYADIVRRDGGQGVGTETPVDLDLQDQGRSRLAEIQDVNRRHSGAPCHGSKFSSDAPAAWSRAGAGQSDGRTVLTP